MKLAAADLTQVPDVMPQLEPGIYTAAITKVELKPAEGKQLERFEVTFQIDDGPSKGRLINDNFALEYLGVSDPKNPHFVQIRFKNLLTSAGVPITSEIDTDDLKGKTAKFSVKRTYSKPSPENPEVKEYSNIDKYIWKHDA